MSKQDELRKELERVYAANADRPERQKELAQQYPFLNTKENEHARI